MDEWKILKSPSHSSSVEITESKDLNKAVETIISNFLGSWYTTDLSTYYSFITQIELEIYLLTHQCTSVFKEVKIKYDVSKYEVSLVWSIPQYVYFCTLKYNTKNQELSLRYYSFPDFPIQFQNFILFLDMINADGVSVKFTSTKDSQGSEIQAFTATVPQTAKELFTIYNNQYERLEQKCLQLKHMEEARLEQSKMYQLSMFEEVEHGDETDKE